VHLILCLLLATCLTGCVPRFPFYCEDANASICYLQRRPIFAPQEKPVSDPKPERRDGELPDDAPRSPSAPIATRHAGASVNTCLSSRHGVSAGACPPQPIVARVGVPYRGTHNIRTEFSGSFGRNVVCTPDSGMMASQEQPTEKCTVRDVPEIITLWPK
jgi:hypothetical protein